MGDKIHNILTKYLGGVIICSKSDPEGSETTVIDHGGGKMVDINVVVANNISELMRRDNKKQIDLANAIGVSKQIMSKMLNGSRLISIAELSKIADYFNVKTDDLMKAPDTACSGNVVKAFMGKVNTEAAREALRTVDELADMIIYHANIRENAAIMSETWEM